MSEQDYQSKWQQRMEALGEQAMSGDMDGAYQRALEFIEEDEHPNIVKCLWYRLRHEVNIIVRHSRRSKP